MIRYTKKMLIWAVVIGVVGLSTSLQAAVTVDNISLKKLDGFTEVTVYTSKPVEFSHEIVDPGAGKPYRVVIDIKNALHDLPRFNYTELPSQTITSIRTSQFSVNPEKTVRVVLDVNGKVTYKTRSAENTVTIALITPDDPEFPFWCAQPISETEKLQLALSTPNDQNEAEYEEEPVLVSSVVSEKPDEGPKLPSWVENQVQPRETEPEQNPAATTVELAEPVKEYKEPTMAMEIFQPEFVIPEPQISEIIEEKPLQPAGMTDSAVNRETGVQDSNVKDDSEQQAPEKAPTPNIPSKESEGEEFRQNPNAPTKTSGTLADRFPKRKVVTYQSWGRADPFAALIDSRGRSGKGPDEIPDVESLRLVGVLLANDETSALLEDLEGYGYILKDGDPVKNGYVVQIGREKIIFHLSEYGWSRTIALKIETDD